MIEGLRCRREFAWKVPFFTEHMQMFKKSINDDKKTNRVQKPKSHSSLTEFWSEMTAERHKLTRAKRNVVHGTLFNQKKANLIASMFFSTHVNQTFMRKKSLRNEKQIYFEERKIY